MTMISMRQTGFAAVLGGALLSGSALAQQAAPAPPLLPPTILVVDVGVIMRESKAGRAIGQQIEAQRQIYTKEISKTEADLRAARDELERQRAILSADAFNQKGREFQQRVDELGRNSQTKRQTLEYSYNLATKQVSDVIIGVVTDIATDRKATLVLPKDAVILVDKSLDVTAETLQRVDQKLPSVQVNIVAPPQQPGQAAAPAATTPAASASTAKAKSTGSSKKKE
jgi:outer membrane protein